jgi:gliding motility-associated-like protein
MPDSYIGMPNAFTPKGEKNKIFRPSHLGDMTLKYFGIYNRWGIKLFETTDVNMGWDGNYKGEPQPMGVYIYIIEAATAKGQKFHKQGTVTLIR